MSDLFLVLAREGGRRRELLRRAAGAARRHPQPFAIQRLKDKLGSRASIERDQFARHLRGAARTPGSRRATIVEMVSATGSTAYTRLGGLMRQALTGRFGTPHIAKPGALIDQPLMATVIDGPGAGVGSSAIGSACDLLPQSTGRGRAAPNRAADEQITTSANAPGRIFGSDGGAGGPGYVEESGMPAAV